MTITVDVGLLLEGAGLFVVIAAILYLIAVMGMDTYGDKMIAVMITLFWLCVVAAIISGIAWLAIDFFGKVF